MKLFKKILIGICILVFLTLSISFFYLRHITIRAIPDYNRDISLENMKETVTIYRDVYAVPHIYAKNEEDLYRAVGYIMAQDRLWQMDLLRRVTTGRLAEIFGAELVETDLLMRALRISEKSKAILAGSNPKIINTLEAFTDGINQFIEKNKNKLPPEFSILGYKPEKWEIIHSLNVVGYMAWDLTMPWPFELTLYKVAQKIGPGSERFKELIPNINFQEPPV
ncbi:MAG TPA: penicillin acylase family protein, partial [Candidatus Kapabacteria bacterium]|nr:penicillin acylase family protein [Candidatus Kapabacteria bacterium]